MSSFQKESFEMDESGDDFLLVAPVKLEVGEEAGTQTDNQALTFLRFEEQQLHSHQLFLVTEAMDKLWSTFLVFNLLVLPCVLALVTTYLSEKLLMFSDVPIMPENVLAIVTTACLIFGVPVYILCLAETDDAVFHFKIGMKCKRLPKRIDTEESAKSTSVDDDDRDERASDDDDDDKD